MICHDASLRPRLCRALPPRCCRSGSPPPPAPPAAVPRLLGTDMRHQLGGAPGLGLKQIVFVHMKPFVSACGLPPFSNTAEKQFRVTGNTQPGWRRGSRGGRQAEMTLASRPPGQLSPLEPERRRWRCGAARGLNENFPLRRVCPSQLFPRPPGVPGRGGPASPPPAGLLPPRCCAIAGYFSQDVTFKWHNL